MIKDTYQACRKSDEFQISPIGIINKQEKIALIEIFENYTDGLLGLNQFSHLIVCFWFHKADGMKRREVLQVHPRGNRQNPLTGVFATRSPTRPNPLGLSICKILSIKDSVIHVDQIDAFNKSPVMDIKPYIPTIDSVPDATTPGWTER